MRALRLNIILSGWKLNKLVGEIVIFPFLKGCKSDVVRLQSLAREKVRGVEVFSVNHAAIRQLENVMWGAFYCVF